MNTKSWCFRHSVSISSHAEFEFRTWLSYESLCLLHVTRFPTIDCNNNFVIHDIVLTIIVLCALTLMKFFSDKFFVQIFLHTASTVDTDSIMVCPIGALPSIERHPARRTYIGRCHNRTFTE
jgi:hypothetical protein